eukprot:UN00037
MLTIVTPDQNNVVGDIDLKTTFYVYPNQCFEPLGNFNEHHIQTCGPKKNIYWCTLRGWVAIKQECEDEIDTDEVTDDPSIGGGDEDSNEIDQESEEPEQDPNVPNSQDSTIIITEETNSDDSTMWQMAAFIT